MEEFMTPEELDDLEREKWRRVCFLICPDDNCRYMEFPGCGDHHVLFSKVVANSKGDVVSIGCESCEFTTANTSPFMDNCRGCKKVKARPNAWVTSKAQIIMMHAGIQGHSDKVIDTGVLLCPLCKSVNFPVFEDLLLKRNKDGKIYDEKAKQVKENRHFTLHHMRKECKGNFTMVPVRLSKDEARYVRDHLSSTAPMDIDVWLNRSKPKIAVNDEELQIAGLIGRLKDNPKLSDVTLLIGEGKTSFAAHKIVLAARSPVFQAMFYSGFAEAKAKEIEIPDGDPEHYETMLQFMYSDDVDINAENVFPMLFLAKRYGIEGLRRACVVYLQTGVDEDNVMEVFEACPGMMEEERHAMRYIEDNAGDVVSAEGFSNLTQDAVVRVCQSDKLNVNESDLFKAVIVWGVKELMRRSEGKEEKDGKELPKVETKSAGLGLGGLETKTPAKSTTTTKSKPVITVTKIPISSGSSSGSTSGKETKKEKDKKKELTSLIATLKSETAMKELLGDTDLDLLRELVAPAVQYIRFPLMRLPELGGIVAPCNVVEKNHMVTLFMRASLPSDKQKTFTWPKGFPFSNDIRLPRAVLLTYQSDYDQNGLCYLIATKNKTSTWINPVDAGRIGLVHQGTLNGAVRGWMEITPPTDNFYINNGRPNMMTIDFKEHKLMPTHYTLRHNSSHTSAYLGRNWKLEGSADGGGSWDVLIAHANDQKMAGGSVLVVTWEIVGARRFYSRFRLVQTGNGSDGTDQYMMFNGFEIYGKARFGRFE